MLFKFLSYLSETQKNNFQFLNDPKVLERQSCILNVRKTKAQIGRNLRLFFCYHDYLV